MAVLQRGVLGCKLKLDEHHVVTHPKRQGQRRTARQEVTDLRRVACQPRGPSLQRPGPARPSPPRCVTWGLSPPLSGLWGPCRCHGCLNKMNRYFRKPPPPARPGPGAAGGCGGQRHVRRWWWGGGLALPGQLGSCKGKLRPEGAGPSWRALLSNNPPLLSTLWGPRPSLPVTRIEAPTRPPAQSGQPDKPRVGGIPGQILRPNLCFLKINIYLSGAGQELMRRPHCWEVGGP